MAKKLKQGVKKKKGDTITTKKEVRYLETKLTQNEIQEAGESMAQKYDELNEIRRQAKSKETKCSQKDGGIANPQTEIDNQWAARIG